MKNKYLFFISLLTLLFTFAGCGGTGYSPGGAAPDKKPPQHYRGDMKPLDELAPAERIVILQNVFNSSTREGFFTKDTRPAAVEIEYNGGKATAWQMNHAIDFLHKGCEGTVTVIKTGGDKAEFSAGDFSGMYVMLDLRSDDPPVLYNPATKSAATDFSYAVTSDGEAIYSVVSGAYENFKEMLTKVGWKTDATYRVVATDKFHLPVGPEEAATGELRGALSGVVNGSFPDLSLAGGKINDVLYIEPIVE